MSSAYHSLADSDFDSLVSTPSSEEHMKKMTNTSVSVAEQLDIHDAFQPSISLISSHANTTIASLNYIDDNLDSTQPFIRTASGRVKELAQKFETSTSTKNVPPKVIYKTSNISSRVKMNNNENDPNFVIKNNVDNLGAGENRKFSITQDRDFLDLVSKQIISEMGSEESLQNDIREELKNVNFDVKKRRQELSKSLSVKHKLYVRRVSSKINKYKKMIIQSSCAPQLFDCCMLVGLNISDRVPYVKMKYPENYNLPPGIEMLCFPDADHWNWPLNTLGKSGTETDQSYSLVLTDESGNRRFGFCRRVIPEGAGVCLPLTYCIISPFRTVNFYNKILKELETRHGLPDVIFSNFLKDLYATPFPRPGETVKIMCRVHEPILVLSKEVGYEPIEIGGQFLRQDEGHRMKQRNDKQLLRSNAIYGRLQNSSTVQGNISYQQNDLNRNLNTQLKCSTFFVQRKSQENLVKNSRPNSRDSADMHEYAFVSHAELQSGEQLNKPNLLLPTMRPVKVKSTELENRNFKKELIRSHSSPLLKAEINLTDNLFTTEVLLMRPYDNRVDENDLVTLCESLQLTTIIQIFGSILLERKVIFVCKSLSKLSTCIEALQSMLYPFSWQHTYIPVLPGKMIDILNAPTPFIIGVLQAALVEDLNIEEGIAVDLDTSIILHSMGDELAILPTKILRCLKVGLTSIASKSPSKEISKNLLISEAFVNVFVQLCGNYKQFISINNKRRHFEKEAFIHSNSSKTIQLFLEWFTETSMFNAFLDSFLNSTDSCLIYDVFSQRVSEHLENANKKKSLSEKLKKWTLFM